MSRWTRTAAAAATLFLTMTGCASTQVTPPATVTFEQVADAPAPAADHRIRYGSEASQFGELRLPDAPGPHPVALLVHGGCWSSAYDLSHLGAAAEELRREGVATWTIEYRRLGEEGGGWPGTFYDVAAAADHLLAIADSFDLDLERVVAVGHSAGGHLALWLAARDNLSERSELWHPTPLPLAGVVALAAISDLEGYAAQPGGCNQGARDLLEAPATAAERATAVNPLKLLPLWIPLRLLHGELDPIVPVEQSRSFAEAAAQAGDDAELRLIPNAGHSDLVAPFTPAWEIVETAILELIARG